MSSHLAELAGPQVRIHHKLCYPLVKRRIYSHKISGLRGKLLHQTQKINKDLSKPKIENTYCTYKKSIHSKLKKIRFRGKPVSQTKNKNKKSYPVQQKKPRFQGKPVSQTKNKNKNRYPVQQKKPGTKKSCRK